MLFWIYWVKCVLLILPISFYLAWLLENFNVTCSSYFGPRGISVVQCWPKVGPTSTSILCFIVITGLYHPSVCAQLLSHVWLFETPTTVAHQAPLSMEFSRQEYWSGLPFPSSGALPSCPRDQACICCISCIDRWILYHCTTWEALWIHNVMLAMGLWEHLIIWGGCELHRLRTGHLELRASLCIC